MEMIMKKKYIIPAVNKVDIRLYTNLMGLSAPGEGISDGGEGSDGDDPDSKRRKKGGSSWNSLW